MTLTKLRPSSTGLHGVSNKSRVFDPTYLFEVKTKPPTQELCVYVFVAAYVIFVLYVGLKSRKDTVGGGGDTYLLGGRSIGPVITSFSFAAT